MAKKPINVLDVPKGGFEDITKKYVYVLANKNEARGRVFDADGKPLKDPEYPPRRNLLLKSSVVWPKDPTTGEGMVDPFSEKVRKPGKYLIRFYDGCSTLFVDEQPEDVKAIEQFVQSTRQLFFINGYLEVYGYDTMLKAYMDMSSWNGESPYRIETVPAVYIMLDSEKAAVAEAERLDKIEQALEYAKSASEKKMRIHCRFLNVADIDLRTSQKLSPQALRAEYRKAALNDPKGFIKTFNDKSLKYQAYIEKALESGAISTSIVPNRAVWKEKGTEICDISGLKSKEAILNKLIEFSQSKDGEEFAQILETLYE